MSSATIPVSFLKTNEHAYAVVYSNGVHLGDLLRGEDGFFAFYDEPTIHGYWEAWILRLIADKLDHLNAEWNATIDNDPTFGPPTK